MNKNLIFHPILFLLIFSFSGSTLGRTNRLKEHYEETGNGFHEYAHAQIVTNRARSERTNIHSQIGYATSRMLKNYRDMLKIGGSVKMVEMRDRMNQPYVPNDPEPIHTFLAFANILEGIA